MMNLYFANTALVFGAYCCQGLVRKHSSALFYKELGRVGTYCCPLLLTSANRACARAVKSRFTANIILFGNFGSEEGTTNQNKVLKLFTSTQVQETWARKIPTKEAYV